MILDGPPSPALMAALHRDCFPVAERWDEAAMTTLLAMPGCLARLWSREDVPAGIGLARVAADEAELLTLGVLPEARGKGGGRALVESLADACASLGAERLLLEVAVANLAARALYRAAGFEPVGRRARYYPDGGDALVLARLL